MELHLDRRLAERRIFPAIDMLRSGTRREDLLLSKEELEKTWLLRKSLTENNECVEDFLKKLKNTETNKDFLAMIALPRTIKSTTAS